MISGGSLAGGPSVVIVSDDDVTERGCFTMYEDEIEVPETEEVVATQWVAT